MCLTSTVQTSWDVERFFESVKTIKMSGDYISRIKEEVAQLNKKFPISNHSRHSNEPATVLDAYGHIMVWHLPDVISSLRVVSQLYVVWLLLMKFSGRLQRSYCLNQGSP